MLFTFAGGSGHLEPLVPIARAAATAGHTVAFAGRPRMVPEVEKLGFPAFASGSDVGLTPKRLPLADVDVDRDMRAVGPGFGRRIARERAADLLRLCAPWRPDLLVCEEVDFGAMVAAERLALPHATVLVLAAGGFVRPELVAGPLDEVRAEHGLPADPELAAPWRHLALSPFPPSFRDPAFPLPHTAHAVRLAERDPARSAAVPAWIEELGTAPTVYLTLGTIYSLESGDLFQRVLAGLRDLPIQLVVTVGRDLDPEELGPQPDNVRIERFVPQAALLPSCHLVVSHGGSGSVMGALAHGLPMVLVPMGADQPLNAARCKTLGVAEVLDAGSVTSQGIREAVSRTLESPGHRRAAERLRDEIAALRGPEHAVTLLERLHKPRHGFTRVDEDVHPAAWVACLDKLHAEPFYREYKARIRALLEPQPTGLYLEVGAGVGTDAMALGARVLGVDRSSTMCREARARGLVTSVVADAEALPFPPGLVDGCWSDRTFQHLAHPQRALEELVRVMKAGATLVVADPDYGTQRMEFPDPALASKVLEFRASHALRHGTLAHEMGDHFAGVGLADVSVEERTLVVRDPRSVDNVMGLRSWARTAAARGRLTEIEADRWETAFDAVVAAGRFCWSVTFFLTSGRKPGAAR